MRLPVKTLKFSAVGFAALVAYEAFTYTTIIPTKGDRPTVGFGSTFKEDGTPVKMGETITPTQAVIRSVKHIEKDEVGLKRCVTGKMSQAEYDILVDFTYQYGVELACSSSMVRHINAGNYEASCNAYTLYRKVGPKNDRYDCSTLVNGKPNKRCWGVWTRSLERKEKCLSALS